MLAAALVAASGPLHAGSFGRRQPESRSTIVYVDAKNAFVVIDKGPKDGIRVGTEFDIVRVSEAEVKYLGKAVCEKFLGQNTMSKLVLKAGHAAEMVAGDLGLYDRRN